MQTLFGGCDLWDGYTSQIIKYPEWDEEHLNQLVGKYLWVSKYENILISTYYIYTIKFLSSNSIYRVGTIDLARNNLTKIEREMFADLRFVDTIDVAENQIREIAVDAFKLIYLTKVRILLMGSLSVWRCVLLLLQKRNVEHILIHFKVNISHNQIEQINNGAFKFCENMTVLDLSHNKIKRLAPDTFDKNSYTTELKLNDNQVFVKKFTVLFYMRYLI